MGIYDQYNYLGKNNITATSSDFTNMVGEDGVKEVVKKVFLGGNVRDVTEFITQRRLINSYSAMIDLYLKELGAKIETTQNYTRYVAEDLMESKSDAKKLDLWLLGLTQKGLDNIVRTQENIIDYQCSFAESMDNAVKNLKSEYGELKGTIEINDRKLDLSWNVISYMLMAMGAQTLSIRGSEKSMNGKMFEKLVLGSILSVMEFTFLAEPPTKIDKNKKYFWLSNMDENERETDATVIYNGIAVSIDIGFIGKGNPEITLDKVTRFNAYKQIGGIPHDMSTIIIVDTVGKNSDLFHKAERVNGHVLQMKNRDWTIEFSKMLCKIMHIKHELSDMDLGDLDSYFESKLESIDISMFIKKDIHKKR